MEKKALRPVYGPVPSWRLGRSLGLDPICRMGKVCSFDCLYCQQGRTKVRTRSRRVYVRPSLMARELALSDKSGCDAITFSGTGEPTLNSSLGAMIEDARGYQRPVAVLTNSSLISDPGVRTDLSKADTLCLKLDAPDQDSFRAINRPVRGIRLDDIIEGIKAFRRRFRGKMAIQTMFIAQNSHLSEELASLSRELRPDEVQLDTPLRRSAVRPLSRTAMERIEDSYSGLRWISVYRAKMPEAEPLDVCQTRIRRP